MDRLLINPQRITFLEICSNNSSGVNGLGIVERSQGAIPLGSVYQIGKVLEDEGFVTSHLLPPAHREGTQRIFTITGKGKLLLDFWERLKNMDPSGTAP